MTDQGLTMPDDTRLADDSPDSVSSAVVKHIDDEIEDARSLRGWRKMYAIVMLVIACVFYVVLLHVICCFLKHTDFVVGAPTVALGMLVILAAVPTLILISVSKAVFGKRATDDAYTPLQAFLHLMKEMKEN